jgi:hypothetical protein
MHLHYYSYGKSFVRHLSIKEPVTGKQDSVQEYRKVLASEALMIEAAVRSEWFAAARGNDVTRSAPIIPAVSSHVLASMPRTCSGVLHGRFYRGIASSRAMPRTCSSKSGASPWRATE